jgi:hypothetical protein
MLFLHEQKNAKITDNTLDLEQSIYKLDSRLRGNDGL